MSEAIFNGDLTTLGLLPPFTPGRGYFEYLFPADSGSGNTTLFSVVPSQRRRLISLHYQWSLSAVVANRFIHTQLVDADGHVFLDTYDNIAHAASTLVDINVSPAYSGPLILGASGPWQYHGFPDIWLPGGFTVRASIAGRQAGDVLTVSGVMVMTIPVGQGGYELGRNP